MDDEALARLDVLILCTTEGPHPTAAEMSALKAWVAAGGALLVSAFSNWSAYEHYAEGVVGWLGIETIPHARFSPKMTHTMRTEVAEYAADTDDDTRRLLHGPFGAVRLFQNLGESSFIVTPAARSHGAVRLIIAEEEVAHQAVDAVESTFDTLLYYPPGHDVTRKGRVLVCSNYHWLCDPHHWNGGQLMSEENQNGSLVLNFVALAVASRVEL